MVEQDWSNWVAIPAGNTEYMYSVGFIIVQWLIWHNAAPVNTLWIHEFITWLYAQMYVITEENIDSLKS